jgi:chromosome segregation ATPase
LPIFKGDNTHEANGRLKRKGGGHPVDFFEETQNQLDQAKNKVNSVEKSIEQQKKSVEKHEKDLKVIENKAKKMDLDSNTIKKMIEEEDKVVTLKS